MGTIDPNSNNNRCYNNKLPLLKVNYFLILFPTPLNNQWTFLKLLQLLMNPIDLRFRQRFQLLWTLVDQISLNNPLTLANSMMISKRAISLRMKLTMKLCLRISLSSISLSSQKGLRTFFKKTLKNWFIISQRKSTLPLPPIRETVELVW